MSCLCRNVSPSPSHIFHAFDIFLFVFWQELGKYNIISIEDIVHEIATVGPRFKEVVRFLEPFVLTKPDGGFLGKKQPYKEGGEAGNREDEINDLISKMN